MLVTCRCSLRAEEDIVRCSWPVGKCWQRVRCSRPVYKCVRCSWPVGCPSRAEEDNVGTKSQLGSTLCPCTAICVRSRMDNVGTTSRLGFAVAMIMLGSRRPSLGPLSGSLTHATAVRPGAEQRCEALRRTPRLCERHCGCWTPSGGEQSETPWEFTTGVCQHIVKRALTDTLSMQWWWTGSVAEVRPAATR